MNHESIETSSLMTPFRNVKHKYDNTPQGYHHPSKSILRSRSLDLGNSDDNKMYRSIYNNYDTNQYEECYDDIASTATSLNSSFDAALLGKGSSQDEASYSGSANIFRSSGATSEISSTAIDISQKLSRRVETVSSWDERKTDLPSLASTQAFNESQSNTSKGNEMHVGRKHQGRMEDTSLLPNGSSRKHLRRDHTLISGVSTPRRISSKDCLGPSSGGGTARRLPLVTHSQATPGSTSRRRKATPLSQNRKIKSPYQIHRAPLISSADENTQLQATMTPLFPASTSYKLKPQTCNTATTANTSHTSNGLDLTIDTATDQSHESPTSTPFRFSAFPASLPRVNPRSTDSYQTSYYDMTTPFDSSGGRNACPNTTRKKMTFSGALGSKQRDNADSILLSKRARPLVTSNALQQDETGQTSSVSSICGIDQYGQVCPQASFPPPFPPTSSSPVGCQSIARRIDTNFSDDSDTPEPRQKMPFLRSNPAISGNSHLFLNDNVHNTYSYSDDDDDDDSPSLVNVSRTRLNFNLALSPTEKKNGDDVETEDNLTLKLDCSNNGDLSRQSASAENSGYDPATLAPLQNSNMKDNTNRTFSTRELEGDNNTPRFSYGAMITDERASSPAEEQFRFRLDAAQCSPILPHAESSTRDFIDRSPPAAEKPLSPVDETAIERKDSMEESKQHSFSQQSTEGHRSEGESSTSSSKQRRLRPMPDMSAFDAGASVRSSSSSRAVDKSDESGILSLPKLTCPPTPVRTPAWAHVGNNGKTLVRANSLIVTKVLATCPPPQVIMDGQSTSLEDSFMDDEIKSNTTDEFERRKASLSFATVDEEMEQQSFGTTDAPEQNNTSDISTPTKTDSNEFILRHVSASDSLDNPSLIPKTPFVPPRLSQLTKQAAKRSGELISFVADFENLGQLGRGTFADVYKVRSKSDQKLYAVKRNRRQFRGKRDRDLAMAEVRTMQKLQGMTCTKSGSDNSENGNSSKSPSIFSMYILFFYRAWQEEGYFYCQTALCSRDTCRELIESLRCNWTTSAQRYPSMKKYLKAETTKSLTEATLPQYIGRLTPESTIWKICHDIVSGLSHIHSHNIVHHDIKPSNIFFVSHLRVGAICKIGDFGMAGDVGTAEDGQEGDTMYMPPELLSSSVKHPSSDIFSLGLTLYELASPLGWEIPVEGPRWHQLRDGMHTPELSPSCHPDLSQLIKAMISREQSKRPMADHILKQYPMVSKSSCQCDEFLRDYIHDVEAFDLMQESRFHYQIQQSEQTPKNESSSASNNPAESYHIHHQRELRTPTPGISPSIASPSLCTPNA